MEYNDIPYFSRKNKAKFSKMISENQRNQRDTKKCTVANYSKVKWPGAEKMKEKFWG